MTIDKIILAEIDEVLPWLRSMMNEYALHPIPGNANIVEAYINLLPMKLGKEHYEAMTHAYNGIQAANMDYGDQRQ